MKMKVSPFAQDVYDIIKLIPKGKISTYKKVAIKMNKPGASQAVGQALRCNPYAPEVPCHRIISSDFSIGGFYGSTDLISDNIQKKITLLKSENIEFEGNEIKSCPKYREAILFDFNINFN